MMERVLRQLSPKPQGLPVDVAPWDAEGKNIRSTAKLLQIVKNTEHKFAGKYGMFEGCNEISID